MDIKKVAKLSEEIKNKINDIFYEEYLGPLAKETKFVQRSTSKLEGKDFIELMTIGILLNPEVSMGGLCDILLDINPFAEMTGQALNQRINTEGAVKYLEEVFKFAYRKNLEPIREKISIELLDPFNRVFLEDSTQCSLHEKLAEKFKGSGGSASKSSLKIDLIYEFKQDVLQEFLITDGRDPDQSNSENILKHLQKDDLILRDLGYFSLDSLIKIQEKEAFFLSRLPKGVNVYLSEETDASPIDLAEYIDQNFPRQTVIDLDVYLGEERMFCRLIGYRLSEEVVNQRRRKAYETFRKRGKTPPKDYLRWLEFGFYITNVSRGVWADEVVWTIYRLRWQIELIFKNWKSLLKIDMLKGERSERIKCFLYGRLITIIIMNMLYAYASWYAKNYLKRELSSHKLINWLKRKDRLAKAIHFNFLGVMLSDLIECMPKSLCKQKRKRKTSRQLLESCEHQMKNSVQEEGILLAKVS